MGFAKRILAIFMATALALPAMAITVQAADDYTLHEWKFENDLTHTVDGQAGALATLTGDKSNATGGAASYNTGNGKSGSTNAFNFNGSTGLSLGTGVISSDTYTISLWVRPTSYSNYTAAFFGLKDADSWLSIVPRPTSDWNQTVVWARNGTGDEQPWYGNNTLISQNTWSHLAVVANGTTLKYYINGSLVATSNTTVGNGQNNQFFDLFSNGAGTFFLGVNPWDSAFNGRIDEVRIYDNGALNDAGVLALYNALEPTEAQITVGESGGSDEEPTEPAGPGTVEWIVPGAAYSYNESTTAPYTEDTGTRASNVTVHDPSIVKAADGTYVITGSHFASAKSTNLITLTQTNEGYSMTASASNYYNKVWYWPKDNANTSIQTMEQQLATVGAKTSSAVNYWACDIVQVGDKYYLYYSLSSLNSSDFDSSAIGLAIGDSANGPFTTQGLIVKSGASNGGKAMNGSTTYNRTIHPNCIDAQGFLDKKGDLWMVYGSYGGGIFIYEMENATGMPKSISTINNENAKYGTKLIANSWNAIEAPYVLYSPETGYYYLFTTFFWLGSETDNGGYNVRIFRSKDPEGPYEDAEHTKITAEVNDTADAYLKNQAYTDGDNTTFYFNDLGVKILGGYQFLQTTADNNQGMHTLSPGHNSAYYDKDTKKYYLIYHTRFDSAGVHNVHIREMFVTDGEWLAAAPLRSDGGNVREFYSGELVGSYKVIVFSDKTKLITAVKSTPYHLIDDGTIKNTSAAVVGSWELSDDRKTAIIKLNGVRYEGVFLRQWDNDNSKWVQAFTAISDDGVEIWGQGVSGLTTPTPAKDSYSKHVPLAFEDSDYYDIPASTIGTTIADIDVSDGVSGGAKPYTFTATSLPEWLTIDETTGIISGTPTTVSNAGTATITVTDSNEDEIETASIEIAYGAVSVATYIINYYLDGGVLPEGAPTTYTFGVGLTLPIPTKDGYTFEGWYDDDQFTGDAIAAISTTDTGAKDFYAKWLEIPPETYIINYYLDDGVLPDGAPTTYTFGVGLTLPIPTKDGYTFEGWYGDDQLTGDTIAAISTTDTGAKGFYAKWVLDTPITPVGAAKLSIAPDDGYSITVPVTLTQQYIVTVTTENGGEYDYNNIVWSITRQSDVEIGKTEETTIAKIVSQNGETVIVEANMDGAFKDVSLWATDTITGKKAGLVLHIIGGTEVEEGQPLKVPSKSISIVWEKNTVVGDETYSAEVTYPNGTPKDLEAPPEYQWEVSQGGGTTDIAGIDGPDDEQEVTVKANLLNKIKDVTLRVWDQVSKKTAAMVLHIIGGSDDGTGSVQYLPTAVAITSDTTEVNPSGVTFTASLTYPDGAPMELRAADIVWTATVGGNTTDFVTLVDNNDGTVTITSNLTSGSKNVTLKVTETLSGKSKSMVIKITA
ncbi:MAG: family 43 glycosylhydrolase [Clostridiales bacterium]|jgi:arabinan endo-1,5-alpha-L-arabinosidase|nr:family 43 glycosylhydrolase [Clostridiales bacterium]